MSAADTKALLVRAKNLINDKRRWVKGKSRKYVRVDEKTVYGYCAIGAIEAAAHAPERGHLSREAQRALARAVQSRGFGGIVGFNDDPHTTHTDVMQAFSDAIAEQAREIGVGR